MKEWDPKFWKGKRYTIAQVRALVKMHRYDQRIARLPAGRRKQRRHRLQELKRQAYAEFVAATLDK